MMIPKNGVKDTKYYPMHSLNCKRRLLPLEVPVVMGIINVTTDSFYANSRKTSPNAALDAAAEMLKAGASILDIGGASSRPGATPVDETTETQRVLPLVKAICHAFPEALISVDTFRSKVARKAVEAGACIINDISGGEGDPLMFETVAELQVPYVLMHMQGTPPTMQNHPEYTDVVQEVCHYFQVKSEALLALGVKDVVLDPGFGFGKTLAHNYQLLNGLDRLRQLLPYPILAGVSRKTMIHRVTGTQPQTALNGTTVVHTMALERGVSILRVHDVKEAIEAIKIVSFAQANHAPR